jgi:hypothetical protein
MPTPVQSKLFIHTVILASLAAGLFSVSARSAETPTAPVPEKPSSASPWGFNLTTYMWLPGVNGDFTAGSRSSSVDNNFIDIVDKSRRFPLGFSGHFEAHYDRFAFYLDGNYFDMQLKPVANRISQGVDVEMGIMDYGLMYRIFGAKASEIPAYQGKKRPIMLDVYAGARTIWLGASAAISGPFGLIERNPTVNGSFTSPIIGGRFGFDFTPNWFVMVDGNIGGFGAQSVDLTDTILGAVGYRMTLFGVPASIEAGYKALHYEVNQNGPTATNVTMNGPFMGLTGYW